MRIRWPRRRWGIVNTMTAPDGMSGFTDQGPARYWTRAGAERVARQHRAVYAAEPRLSERLTVAVEELGPFSEAACWAQADREDAEWAVRKAHRS